MKNVMLGKTGESVSQFALGCMLMGTVIDKPTSFAILDHFMNEGGNFLDTANCYAWWIGNGQFVGDESESMLGEWMQARKNRADVFLATKAGARLKNPKRLWDAQGNAQWHLTQEEFEYLAPATIRQTIEGSLRRLQTDYIDLYYAHIDDRKTPLEETLDMLNQLVKEGKVKYIACSNYRTWRLERARQISAAHGWTPYIAIQQQYSYFRPKVNADFGTTIHADAELMDYLQANEEVALLAYSPILKGIYDDQKKREASYLWPSFNTEDSRIRLETLNKMAQEIGVSNSQLVLAWLLHHQPRVIPILGMSKLEHIYENLKAADIHLSDKQMALLTNVSA